MYIYSYNTVDGCEILHQLIGGKHPIIDRVSTIRLVMQDFFHPQYVSVCIYMYIYVYIYTQTNCKDMCVYFVVFIYHHKVTNVAFDNSI